MTDDVMNKEQKLLAINDDVSKVVDESNRIEITDDISLQGASEFLIQVVARRKRVDDIRQFFVRPLNDQVKNINGEFKKATEPLSDIELSVKTKILDYRTLEAKRIEKENAKKEKENSERATDEPMKVGEGIEIAEVQQNAIQTTVGSIRTRKVWTYKIESKSKIPKKYWIINERAINDAVKQGARKIAGVKIFQEEGISVYK